MKRISKMLNAFKTKGTVSLILMGLLFIAVIFGVRQCDKKKAAIEETEKQRNNISALTDSVRDYRNKEGELSFEKKALQTDKEQLKEINEELSEEIEKERDKVESLTKANLEIRGDTSEVDTVVTSGITAKEYRITWQKSSSDNGWSRTLEGYVDYEPDNLTGAPLNATAHITKDQLNLEITTGVANDGGVRRIFIRSTYPNLEVTELDGAILNTKSYEPPNRWHIGPTAGYSFNGQRFSPYIGVGITYSLISF